MGLQKGFFFQAEDGIRDGTVTGVQTCALPISVDMPVMPAVNVRAFMSTVAVPSVQIPEINIPQVNIPRIRIPQVRVPQIHVPPVHVQVEDNDSDGLI